MNTGTYIQKDTLPYCKNQSDRGGYLGLYMGPMFSGKTTLLQRIKKDCNLRGLKTVVINHCEDIRYSETKLSTHDENMIDCIWTDKLNEKFPAETPQVADIDVFLINEGQFFPDLVDWAKKMVSGPYYKMIFVFGLDGDFQRKPFGNWLDLIPFSDEICKLQSVCGECRSRPAIFSHRLTKEIEQKVIGSNSYIPLCRKCYEEAQKV